MNKITAAAALLTVIIVATATTWFFLNQTYTPNQTNAVRITSFSVDPEGWRASPDRPWVACLFNITIQNNGTNDEQGLWLKVTMFGFGEIVRHSKSGSILAVNSGLRGFALSAGEVRTFQGEMHGGTTLDSLHRSPVGATYLAQVVVGSSNVLDEAEWTDPFAIVFAIAIIAIGLTLVIVVMLVYFKKRKR